MWKRMACSIQKDFRFSGLLPDGTPIRRRTHHGGIILTAECLLELRQVRERSDHSILANGVRIALDHGPLRLRTNLVAAPLSPGDKELLLRGEAVNSRLRV